MFKFNFEVMPKILLFLLISGSLFVNRVSAQARLTISQLQGFPVLPNDTAYEGTAYDSILIILNNTGNQPFQDGIDILLLTLPSRTDTLFSDTLLNSPLLPGSSTTFLVPRYFFTPNQYDSGDNIVVVWPQARTQQVDADTLTVHVYFQLIQTISRLQTEGFRLYPNPAVEQVQLKIPENLKLERVIINNAIGQEFYRDFSFPGHLHLHNWPCGLYFVHLIDSSGKAYHFTLVKN